MVIFFIFFKIKLHECCVYSLESLHRGDSYEYTNIRFQDKIIDVKLSQLYQYIFSYGKGFYGLKNEFKIAVVNGPSVFEPPYSATRPKYHCPMNVYRKLFVPPLKSSRQGDNNAKKGLSIFRC